jgi:hypothetical protein
MITELAETRHAILLMLVMGASVAPEAAGAGTAVGLAR